VGNPLNPIYDAVAWVLTHIYNLLSPAFGASSGWTWALSIVILVVLMRLVMVPLFIKQMHTTRAMSALAPQMQALRKKYKNDKQTLNQEMMKLYQQAGVNPLMGCLPVVLQLPLFFALFSVLRAIAEWKPSLGPPKYGLPLGMVQSAKQAHIFGVTIADKVLFTDGINVPLHAKVVIFVAVMISMTTTYLTVRQSMKRGMMPVASPDNPMGQSQKFMAYIMPLFALSGLYWPFGLVLYWVTTNVWTLGQQYLLFKRYPQPRVATADGAAGTGSAQPGVGQPPRPRTLPAGGTARSLRPGSSPSAKGDGSVAKGDGSAPSGKSGRSAGTGSTTGAGSSPPGRQRPQNGRRPGAAAQPGAPTTNGQAAADGGGLLRRLGRSRPEPEPEPEPPEVKLVRQQRQRQSRSKRSGKR
jgi:YidC/Oxa1 family membrane protein insertase